ncbi:unnamed protein product [Kuraishia capsulata CBS 1993]|uniref:Alpha-mannosidase n=1 Tax=Kuraishia capsulata CBS 1993 TaxID=1382522 RepID=W6MH23_9ASCO|nr:uncharacterized protein KUCA_T00001203001 [Kuraishia capsulata CBS 1993]CDK25236.1 unnamed protein product [Kuraishia capsulata CBS 1993]
MREVTPPLHSGWTMVHPDEQTYPQLNKDPQFKPVDSIYENRLKQFTNTSGGYEDLQLPKFYVKGKVDNQKDENDLSKGYIQFTTYTTPNLSRPLFKEVIPDLLPEFKPARVGDSFGPGWSTHWFEIKAKVPDSWNKEKLVLLNWDAGNEGLVYDKNGLPLQALTGSSERTEFTIPPSWYESGKEFTFYIEMACNGMFGTGSGTYYTLGSVSLFIPNMDARNLYYDFWIMGDAARELSVSSGQKHKARELCNKIMNTFDPEDESTILKCREIAKSYLGKDIDSDAVFDDKTNQLPTQVYAVGNCHIDTAWLWPFAETKRKIVRSWITQIRIMENYPEYVFVASQAQQFKWLKTMHPDTFDEVLQKVHEGQFVPIGGSWVENDTNIPSGESLSRQFLLGQRFFQDNFGFKSDTFWLPDTFGYSSQIPQFCRLAEMPNFLTQKLSWNNINTFPENTFNWVAIDGSQVLCHMPPANTYTASAHFGDVKRSLQQHKNLYNDQHGLLLYGHGDGGGGPTTEMLEKLRRCRGLTNTVGSELPIVKVGENISSFYSKVRKGTDNGKSLPAWNGELYLEFHRGTYTSQAKVKYMMRTSELLLRDLEYVATVASIQSDSYVYPLDKITAIWEDVCLCQFHDVLPGSCIEIVYRDEVWPMLTKALANLRGLINEALEALGLKEKGLEALSLEESAKYDQVATLNTLPWDRKLIMPVPYEVSAKPLNAQGNLVYMESTKENPTILKPLSSKIKHPAAVSKIDDVHILENGKLKVSVDKNGVITSLYDLVNDREVVDLGGKNESGANQYVIFDDQPLSYGAWDTELYSLEKYKYVGGASKIEILEEGPLRSSLKIQHQISSTSTISTIISLDGLNSLDDVSFVAFECEVDWNEKYKFLKVEFPVSITADYASYETQFGLTKRPTHFNTSWDTAKFEVCSHKFADYSEYSYGVSVINDSKYGFAVHGNLMRLSLLRAPKYPDQTADIGKHHFKYALYPHKGSLGMDTVKTAWEFNSRSSTAIYEIGQFGIWSEASQLVKYEGDSNILLSNIKRGEDDADLKSNTKLAKKFSGHKTIVLRLYDALGGKGKGKITIGADIHQVFKVNILEEEKEEVEFDAKKNQFSIESRAFEISTYKVVLA